MIFSVLGVDYITPAEVSPAQSLYEDFCSSSIRGEGNVMLRKKADKSKINNEKKKPGYRRMKKLKDEKNSGGMFIFMGSEDKHDTGKHKDK